MIERVIGILLIATLVGGLGFLAYQKIFIIETELTEPLLIPGPTQPKPGLQVSGEKPPENQQLVSGSRVLSVSGDVTIEHASSEPEQAVIGAELFASDTIRTGASGETRLQVGKGVEVRVGAGSAFTVEELKEGLSRIQLKSGRVLARVDEKGRRVLQVQSAASDAVVESAGGAFGVVASPEGELAVASIQGKVKVVAKGKEVVLLTGEQTRAMLDSPPETPSKVPSALFLKLAPNPSRHTNQKETEISGETNPGALVEVGKSKQWADRNGKFRLKVPLNAGANQLSVRVRDPLGRMKTAKTDPIMMDQKAPGIDTKVKWGEH